MKTPAIVFLATLMLAAGAATATAQDPARTERVQFAPGTSSKTLKGRIQGDASVNYLVNARAGQTLRIELSTSNASNYFNVWAPGADEALFIGSNSGAQFEGVLPASGDFRIDVYLYRNAARRNEVADYTLTVAVTGAAAPAPHPASPSGDALVPGTPFHATAQVPCATVEGQPTRPCEAGVIRGGAGSATVRVTLPQGGERNIYFEGGEATSSDAAGAIEVQRDGDLSRIRIGTNERYEIVDALVQGG